MYAVGDLILYGRTGVCKVEEIIEEKSGNDTAPRKYYNLRPLYQKCCIRTPVQGGKVYSRPIISHTEARRLIRRLPDVEAAPYHNRNLNELRDHYRGYLEKPECEALAGLTKSLYQKKQEAASQKRKFGAVDQRTMKEAEDLFFGELAAALEIAREDVENYIANSLKTD